MVKLAFDIKQALEFSDVREIPAYTIAEAAHYLCIPKATISAWVKGTTYSVRGKPTRFHRVIDLPVKSKNVLSFYNLAEAHVLRVLRTEYNIQLQPIRKALQFIKIERGWKRPLIQEQFRTDGITLFIQHLGKLLDVSNPQQRLMEELLNEHLKRIDWENSFAARLYPFTRLTPGGDAPRSIVIDPHRSFGRPIVDRLGVTTNVIAERLKAGDTIKKLVKEYGGPQTDIEEAIRCELHIGVAA
jgi:uncharacterized protein (DUF433 family)